ncbi:50S ribosomal protein L29 [Wolbachia endosymbiont of Howardula sp.]|uniref:50S ribosomal protein L29 n=1 Tax=Wolbachia endosymbiont of Howardula sp. TaxID=2916816 RepID=UPI00217E6DF8|nr:50S ribosomal protein L29 [Wolbachia endosymbiont of Howardula sp.]UWI83163.1 50S ribosomal protein L29 [Wolbachia endosymbiont of Howardula sp.]
MNINNIKLKPAKELLNILSDLRKEFVNLMFQKKVGQCVNIARFGVIKKNISHILTILNARKKEEKKNV